MRKLYTFVSILAIVGMIYAVVGSIEPATKIVSLLGLLVIFVFTSRPLINQPFVFIKVNMPHDPDDIKAYSPAYLNGKYRYTFVRKEGNEYLFCEGTLNSGEPMVDLTLTREQVSLYVSRIRED